jgi:Domain of Unknown Function (DUF1259)
MIIHTNAKAERKMRIIDLTPKMGSDYKPVLLAGGLIILTILFSAAILFTTMANDSFAQANNKTIVGSTDSNINPSNTSAAANKLNCQSIATKIAGIVVPNPSKICDVIILRQSPTIIGPGNMNMNKFSTVNSIVEIASVSDLMSKPPRQASSLTPIVANNATAQKVFVMGEFALLESQLVPMVKAAVASNWTIAAVHNHMIQEKPKMIFVHWSAQGDLDTITNQIKGVLLRVSKVPNGSSSPS